MRNASGHERRVKISDSVKKVNERTPTKFHPQNV